MYSLPRRHTRAMYAVWVIRNYFWRVWIAAMIVLLLIGASQARSADLRPVGGGRFDWQQKLPTTWAGADQFGFYKLGLAEVTFILVDERDHELARCLELQVRGHYFKLKPQPKGTFILEIAESAFSPHCQRFRQAVDNAEKSCRQKHGDSYKHYELPCATVVRIQVHPGPPSA